jgi:hypothetical protein
MEKGKKIFFSPIHLKASFAEQPITFLMKIVYLLLIIAIIALCIVYAGIFIVRKIKDESWRKKMLDKFIITEEVPQVKEQ